MKAVSSAIYPCLKGKRVVVTGGAGGIGAAIVADFAAQGAKVAILDLLEKEGKTLATELALSSPPPITFTAVVPGNVRTPRQTRWYTPEAEAEIVEQQCLNERVEPHHVASLVLFLGSEDGRMRTGHEYWIDAGWR